MGNKERLKIAVIVVLALAIVLIPALFFINNSSNFTGKVVVTEEKNIDNSAGAVTNSENPECSGSECNPSNSLQICSDGEWVSCPADEVCSLGNCVVPKKAEFGTSYSGGGGGASEVVTTTVTSANAPAVTSRSIGEINEVQEEIGKNEKIIFTINGIEQNLMVSEISQTNARFSLNENIEFSIYVGEDKLIDIDNNGQNELSIKLKSINIMSNRAGIIIKK